MWCQAGLELSAYSVEKLDRATWPASAQLQNAGGARHTDGFQGYAEAHGRDLHRGSSRGTQTYSPIAHRLELLWWRRDIRVFQQNRPEADRDRQAVVNSSN
jgi:hypothetical protein